jgi:hypothetical protein
MRFGAVAAVLLATTTTFAAPPPKSKIVAPDVVPYPTAMFLNSLSNNGKSRVSFRAAATGTRFFFEETAGVSVYLYNGVNYRRETLLKRTTLEKAMKAYNKKR